ncbi:hypothetical protein D0962_23100 [Leptolyngbyaceae cyanobacterium CCMR0082]|uniref:Uncharacterized protein n=1 Tax=Adonisia turfae CCMR0082 TaxID=2304604 RepID=A0A6M0SAT1_9CYAN|nr:hypothetical protein [Adonisia turfae]NEZ65608.1 hypothetical protein [Adonisia turfae CCMR0082]
MHSPGEIEQAIKEAKKTELYGRVEIARILERDEGAFSAIFENEEKATKYRKKVKKTWYTLLANQQDNIVAVS